METLTMWAENIIENDHSFVLMIDQSEIMTKQLINRIYWFIVQYTNMPCQCEYLDGMSPRGRMLPREDIPSGYPHWHGIFVLLYWTNPNLVKYQWEPQWLPVGPLRTVDILPVDISPVDMMEWPTFVSQSRLTIFTWGIISTSIL